MTRGWGGPLVAIVLRAATPLKALHHDKRRLGAHASGLVCTRASVDIRPFGILIFYPVIIDKTF